MTKETTKINDSWHAYKLEELYAQLSTSREGLTTDEWKKRMEEYGENKLPQGGKIKLWRIIMHQLLNPLIFVLVAAAIASFAIGDGSDSIFIFLVIFINSALGTYQEYNAEKSASSLQSFIKIKAIVLRDGKEREIDAKQLVPGDIILLESGIKVPADMRLMEASQLEIDESFLTGESIAAKKNTAILKESSGVAERTNMAFAGSTVMTGRGLGVVVSTGILTQVGQIAQNVSEGESAKPPLILRMEKFTRQISMYIIGISVVLAVILHFQGMELTSIFFFVVALAVSAIPEGLPVALTVALSIATKRMAKRNVIVRKLTSVESLGSCTVIASDKTGTLTVNEQTAKKIILADGSRYSISGEGYNGKGKITDDSNPEEPITLTEGSNLETLMNISVLANESNLYEAENSWSHHGDAMDVALLGMGFKAGINLEEKRKASKIVGKIPYESENKYSAAFLETKGDVEILAKGAVETILDFCHSMISQEGETALDKEQILNEATELSSQGYRVLAFAKGLYKDFTKKDKYENDDIPSMVLYGLVCFIDPLRPEAKSSVEKCKTAGIKVIMITGDHPATATTISDQLGIIAEGQRVVTGKMLSDVNPSDSEAYEKLVRSTHVFARVSPIQKLEIVEVLISSGEFVAVTGDGVNDAPALKRANIGVAMGSGTDVAKEVGAMIVIDDNFSSIVAGVEEGRFAYDNVRKVIFLLISTGAAEVILFILSIFAGLPLPLLAVQLLWLNLVTNGIQDVALAFEGGEPGTMKKKPRKPSETIFNGIMIKQTAVAGLTMGLIVFGLWYWLITYTEMDETHARDLILLLMVCMQNFHAFNSRSETISIFKIPLKRNFILVFGVLAAQGIHILSMQIPFMQRVLKIEPITPTEWLYVLGLALPILISMEVFKFFYRKTQTKNLVQQ